MIRRREIVGVRELVKGGVMATEPCFPPAWNKNVNEYLKFRKPCDCEEKYGKEEHSEHCEEEHEGLLDELRSGTDKAYKRAAWLCANDTARNKFHCHPDTQELTLAGVEHQTGINQPSLSRWNNPGPKHYQS